MNARQSVMELESVTPMLNLSVTVSHRCDHAVRANTLCTHHNYDAIASASALVSVVVPDIGRQRGIDGQCAGLCVHCPRHG